MATGLNAFISPATTAILFAVIALILAALTFNRYQVPTSVLMSAYSVTDQTLVAGVAANVAHTNIVTNNGIALESPGPASYFLIERRGTYKIIPSLQFLGTQKSILYIWLKVNGINVPDSTTATVFQNNDEGVVTTEYILELDKGDSVQIWAYDATRNVTVNHIDAAGPYPAAPGIITNMYALRFL
jgi:hypothetical protein